MKDSQRDDDAFVEEVRRQAERARRGRHMSFWQGMGLVGAIGWMVSLPAVGGALVGGWLDRWLGTGFGWTLALLLLGLILGCLSSWRYVQRESKQ